MSLLKKYMVIDRYGRSHLLTAKELYERVMLDAKRSDYNWILPARELVRICKSSSFPIEYAIAIKIAILNCSANIEHVANCGGNRYYRDNPADEEAVHYCYNSLYSINTEEAVLARKRYLTEMINTASYINVFDCHYHPGSTFRNLRKDWGKSKFEEYISQEKIDFKQLVETLRNDFSKIIKTAESNGDFKENDEKDKEILRKFYQKIRDL